MRLLVCIFAIGLANAEIRIGLIGDQTSVDDLDASYRVLADGVTALNVRKPQVVLHTGDLLESLRPEDEFRGQFAKATAILNKLNAPWHLSPGDHDVNAPYNQPDETHNRQLFQSLYPAAKDHLYYSFNHAGYHFVALSSQEHHNSDPRWGTTFRARLSDEQMTWLAADLAKNRKSKGTVVFLHQPLWYQWANWAPVHKLLREHGVGAVIAGHFHYNQDEGELDGVRYLVIGATGGMTKHGAGELHHVSMLKIDRKVEVELIPLRGEASGFSTRRDMDRVQALAVTLSNLYADTTVDTCAGKRDVELKSLGNPIDVPLRLRVMSPLEGKYASVCGKGPDCILPPGLLIQSSNNSSVTPERTLSVWTAKMPASKIQLTVRLEFDGERAPLHIEQTITINANCPVK